MNIEFDIDLSQVRNKVKNFVEESDAHIKKVTSRTLGILSMLASATNTTAGRTISALAQVGGTAIRLYTIMANIDIATGVGAAQGLFILSQIPFLAAQVGQALTQGGQINQNLSLTSSVFYQLTSLTGWL